MSKPSSLTQEDYLPSAQALEVGLAHLLPRPHHTRLLSWLQEGWPHLQFEYQLTRSGWYRAGQVRDEQGELLGSQPEAWLQQQLDAVDGDEISLYQQLEESQPWLTRLNGKTHFFTARYGSAVEHLMQLEIEELQEVMDRPLLAGLTEPPDSLLDYLEPVQSVAVDGQILAGSFYRLGQILLLDEQLAKAANAPLLQRFLREWCEGPAADSLQQHWFFQRQAHVERYGQHSFKLLPRAVKGQQLKLLQWELQADPAGIASQLRRYDQLAGYEGAWFFGLVAGNLVPRALAERVINDWQDDYHYITDCQHHWVRSWLHQPYTL